MKVRHRLKISLRAAMIAIAAIGLVLAGRPSYFRSSESRGIAMDCGFIRIAAYLITQGRPWDGFYVSITR